MTRIAQAARITLKGFRNKGVTSSSSIEDQCELVYQAAKHYAQVNGFKPHTHRGKPGLRGNMVMSQVVRSLFPDLSGDDYKLRNGIINSVLRRTDAAVCLKHGIEGEIPEWFVANTMPKNITVVALALKHKSAEGPVGTSAFDEDKFLRPGEKRLRPEETGEDKPPNEVTVKKLTKSEKDGLARRNEAFEKRHAELHEAHLKFLDRLYEEIQTNPIPCTAQDLQKLLHNETGIGAVTTYTGALRELADAGKVVSRKETPEEALVRGGGEAPRATRPQLWWVAPGPVPERTELPAGIEPQTSAAALSRRSQERRNDLTEKVFDLLNVPKGLSLTLLARSLGVSKSEARALVEPLLESGRVYKGSDHRFRPMARRRHDAAVEAMNGGGQPASPEMVKTPAGVAAAPVAAAVESAESVENPYLDKLIEYAKTLIQHQQGAGSGYTQRIAELESELAKAKETIHHLRSALGNLSA
jgi:hypothetical protein